MDTGCTGGGILKLRELIEEHPAEFAYDFRTRFNLSFEAIGYEVSWLEAVYLVAILLNDTSSWLGAVRNEWKYPVSREWIALAHTFDLHANMNQKKGSKPVNYPAPWPNTNSKTIGSKKPQTRSSVEQALERMNPKEHDG